MALHINLLGSCDATCILFSWLKDNPLLSLYLIFFIIYGKILPTLGAVPSRQYSFIYYSVAEYLTHILFLDRERGRTVCLYLFSYVNSVILFIILDGTLSKKELKKSIFHMFSRKKMFPVL